MKRSPISLGEGGGVLTLDQSRLSEADKARLEKMDPEDKKLLEKLTAHPDDDAPSTHEIASEDYKQVIAEMKTISKELTDGRIAATEAGERTERAMKELEKAAKKNIPVPNANPQGLGVGGGFISMAGGRGIPLKWDRAMKMRTDDKDIRFLQELQTRACLTALVKGIASGDHGLGPAEYRLDHIGKHLNPRLFQDVEEYQELLGIRKLAAGSFIDTVTATSGAEWTPTGFARVGVDFPFIDSDFLPQLEQILVPDRVGPFSVPIETARAQSQLVAQIQNVQSAYIRTTGIKTPLTDTWDFGPKVQELGYQWSMEADMDLAIDMLARAIRQTQAGVARGLRQCAINGQDTNDATLDDAPAVSGLESANGWSLPFGGKSFRLHCIENGYTTSLGGAKLTYTDILNARGQMSKFANNPADLFLLTSPKGHIGLLADPNVRTVDVLGPNATILRGMLASVGGLPLFADSEFPENLAITGIDAGTGTTTGAVIVNRRRWAFASKRTVETVIIPGIGTYTMTVMSRARADTGVAVPGSVGGGAGSGEKSAWYLINVG